MGNKTDSKKQIDYTPEVQKLFLRMMMTNAELYTRVMNIMNSENFDNLLTFIVDMNLSYPQFSHTIGNDCEISTLGCPPGICGTSPCPIMFAILYYV